MSDDRRDADASLRDLARSNGSITMGRAAVLDLLDRIAALTTERDAAVSRAERVEQALARCWCKEDAERGSEWPSICSLIAERLDTLRKMLTREVGRREAAEQERDRLRSALAGGWPVVSAFAAEMVRELDRNSHKGDRSAWLRDDPLDLLHRVMQEVVELEHAVDQGAPSDEVISEAADVANMAMMVAGYALQVSYLGLVERLAATAPAQTAGEGAP